MSAPGPAPNEGAILIHRMAAHDRDALARFYDRYAPLAYALVRAIVGEPAEAARVLEEGFWDCWRGAPHYVHEHGTPEAWLVRQVRARALEHMRAARRGGRRLTLPHEPPAASGDGSASPTNGAEVVERFSDRGVLTRALRKLPETQREVVELAYYGGLTQTEIAAHLKQPLGSVKTRLRLGLERLRDTGRILR